LRYLALVACLAVFGFGDTLTLRDGRVVNGSYLGGDVRNVRFAAGDRVDSYRVDDISTISFGGSAPAGASAGAAPPPPPAAATDSGGPALPSGTTLTIRMIDSVDSERDRMGKTFRASLDEPVLDANGNTLIGRGADVVVKLVDDQQSGKITGKTILTLDLVSIQVNGKMVDVNTQTVSQESASRTARSGKVIGGVTALGAIVGGIAGGGKGAAIGAASGAGVGTAAQVATKGQVVKIPSETRLTFTLQQAVRL
jgi:hypothetical protein